MEIQTAHMKVYLKPIAFYIEYTGLLYFGNRHTTLKSNILPEKENNYSTFTYEVFQWSKIYIQILQFINKTIKTTHD